ncbi:hypothetical protein J4440_00525 [Candidatus Woesearchaeota archaeon]|nr:hypothetical protein [Candidatus Woesearchaeota archaeon]
MVRIILHTEYFFTEGLKLDTDSLEKLEKTAERYKEISELIRNVPPLGKLPEGINIIHRYAELSNYNKNNRNPTLALRDFYRVKDNKELLAGKRAPLSEFKSLVERLELQ